MTKMHAVKPRGLADSISSSFVGNVVTIGLAILEGNLGVARNDNRSQAGPDVVPCFRAGLRSRVPQRRWMMCPVDTLRRVFERVAMRRAGISVTVPGVDFILRGTVS